MSNKVLMEEMTWQEVQAALDHGTSTVIIGAGSIEQHGPHIAESCDTVMAYSVAVKLAQRLGNALVAPVIRPGLSSHHLQFPGSISLRKETFIAIVEDYVSSLAGQGFKKFILFSSHGGNFSALEEVSNRLREQYNECTFINGCSLSELVNMLLVVGKSEGVEEERIGAHAGEAETSQMLAAYPHLVRKDKFAPGFLGAFTPALEAKLFSEGLHSITATGVLGDPTADPSADKGEKYLNAWADLLLEKINKVD